MDGLRVVLLLATVSTAFAGWQETLTPAAAAPFAAVRPFQATFRFGWSNVLEAGSAEALFLYPTPSTWAVEVKGQSTGLARALWQLDATYSGSGNADSLMTDRFTQVEKYSRKAITTEAIFEPERVWRQRRVDPGERAKWKRVKWPGLRDLLAAMLFIRSQPLNPKDEVVVTVYPGDQTFLVRMLVIGKETVALPEGSRKALKLELKIQKIVTDGERKGQLEEHRKFRSGTVWLSDDSDRIPLRAEVEVFIGFVYGELTSMRFLPAAEER